MRLTQFRRIVDRKLAKRLGVIVVAGLIGSLLDALAVFLLLPMSRALIDSDGSGGASTAPLLLVVVVVLFVFKSVFAIGVRWWSVGQMVGATVDASAKVFDAYLRAPLKFHLDRNSANLIRTTQSSINNIFNFGLLGLTTLVTEGLTLAAIGIVLLSIAPLPAIVGLIYFSFAAIVYLRVLQPRVRLAAAEVERSSGESVRLIQEGLGSIKEHRVRGTREFFLGRYVDDRRGYASAHRFVLFAAELPRFFLEAVFALGFGLVGLFITLSSGDSSLEEIAVLLGAGFRMLPSISRVMSNVSYVRMSEAALKVLVDDLDALGMKTIDQPAGSHPVEERSVSANSGLVLDAVSFSYDGETKALDSVSASIPAGSSFALVGPSGSGKSTLLDLICGVQIPDSGGVWSVQGDIRYPGCSRVGLVPQDIYLLDGTIFSNVAFGLELDEQKAWRCLGQAGLSEFVQSLPDGLETRIGERGGKISGGERQRIGIARALYCEPSFLVLDEATSALDADAEGVIVESARRLKGTLTTIIVAHRLSTILFCDQVAYLENGRLAALGTLEQVCAAIPSFAELVKRHAERETSLPLQFAPSD